MQAELATKHASEMATKQAELDRARLDLELRSSELMNRTLELSAQQIELDTTQLKLVDKSAFNAELLDQLKATNYIYSKAIAANSRLIESERGIQAVQGIQVQGSQGYAPQNSMINKMYFDKMYFDNQFDMVHQSIQHFSGFSGGGRGGGGGGGRSAKKPVALEDASAGSRKRYRDAPMKSTPNPVHTTREGRLLKTATPAKATLAAAANDDGDGEGEDEEDEGEDGEDEDEDKGEGEDDYEEEGEGEDEDDAVGACCGMPLGDRPFVTCACRECLKHYHIDCIPIASRTYKGVTVEQGMKAFYCEDDRLSPENFTRKKRSAPGKSAPGKSAPGKKRSAAGKKGGLNGGVKKGNILDRN